MLFNMKASYKNTFVRVTRYKNTTLGPEAYLLNFNVSFLNAAFFIHKGFTSLSQPSLSSSLSSHPSPLRISLPPPLSLGCILLPGRNHTGDLEFRGLEEAASSPVSLPSRRADPKIKFPNGPRIKETIHHTG